MTQLTPLQLEDGTVIYIEATDDISAPSVSTESGEERPTTFAPSPNNVQKQVIQSFKAVEGTIRAYTTHTLNALKKVTDADIDKVTLEFGVTVGGEAGVPYVTKGTVESNLKIKVECSYPKNETIPQ